MTQEEQLAIQAKAKRYDELKVTAQKLEHDGCFDKITLFDLFPELKESEDEKMMNIITKVLCTNQAQEEIEKYGINAIDCVAWIEKQVSHPAEWSEEDETVLNNLIYALANDRIGNDRDEYISCLKSLSSRSTWKPSKEQLFDLKCAADSNSIVLLGQSLLSLYNELKKLREEK